MACFIAKRVLLCFGILSITDIIWFESRWYILVGLFSGGILSVAKFGSYTWAFERILSPNTAGRINAGGSITVFALNQLVLLPLLYLAYVLNHWLFAGFVAGILLVPLVIMINCITEATGITKNNFE